MRHMGVHRRAFEQSKVMSNSDCIGVDTPAPSIDQAGFRVMFERSPVGMALVSRQGLLLRVNDALCQLLGHSADELTHQGPVSGDAATDIARERQQLQALLNGQALVQFEKHYRHGQSGQALSTWVSASAMKAGAKTMFYLYQFHVLKTTTAPVPGITEIASLSHEMRTPLNAVIGFAQLLCLQAEHPPAVIRAHATHILDAGRHMLTLVEQTLAAQQVAATRTLLSLRPLSLAQAVDDAQALLLPSAMPLHISLVNKVSKGLHVMADGARLRQVLLNVGSNAVKYNMPMGRVRWCTQALPTGMVRLSVHDTGAGMDEWQLARLFEPFQRLGREHSDMVGSGLGLLITRQLVEGMGGSLLVRSEPGRGTTVQIELRQAPPQDQGFPT